MIQIIAYGLEIGHPAAYCLIFLIVGIPLLAVIILGGSLIIEMLQEKKEKKNKQAALTANVLDVKHLIQVRVRLL